MATKKKKANTQKDLIAVMVISLVLGAGGGFALGAVTSSDDSDSSEKTEQKSGHSHGDHEMYMVSAEDAPTVDLVVSKDEKSGYNIEVMTTNFTFTPESVNLDNVLGEGHAHLYVDGEKVARMYSPYFHYNATFDGTKTFRVTLNTNDHSDYAVDGVVIGAEQTVMDDGSHSHDGDPHSHDNGEMHSHSDM